MLHIGNYFSYYTAFKPNGTGLKMRNLDQEVDMPKVGVDGKCHGCASAYLPLLSLLLRAGCAIKVRV